MKPLKKHLGIAIFQAALAALLLLGGCNVRSAIDELVSPGASGSAAEEEKESVSDDDYYDKFYQQLTRRSHLEAGTSDIKALDVLPKDSQGDVDWTAAVIKGYINPRDSIDGGVEPEPPLNLNIFFEAKTPLMANVLFPHSIHTYWLSCNNCHSNIFIPETGANPVTMDEIFQGQWCGRCHGKVAFTFWPRTNCTRCHVILKGQSLERERWK